MTPTPQPKPISCDEWAALLVDKIDGTLNPEAEQQFHDHVATCASCNLLLEEAEQGHRWLDILHQQATPAPPPDLLGRILEQTAGAGRGADHPIGTFAAHGGAIALPRGRWGIPFLPPPGPHDARLLMTAAMAVFSIGLTLSVAGIRLTSVHAAELRPNTVEATVTRSFFGTKKQVVSFYENLRFVYEVEARINAMRGNSEEAPSQPQQQQQQKQHTPATKPHASTANPAQRPTWHGAPVLAQFTPAQTITPQTPILPTEQDQAGQERSGL